MAYGGRFGLLQRFRLCLMSRRFTSGSNVPSTETKGPEKEEKAKKENEERTKKDVSAQTVVQIPFGSIVQVIIGAGAFGLVLAGQLYLLEDKMKSNNDNLEKQIKSNNDNLEKQMKVYHDNLLKSITDLTTAIDGALKQFADVRDQSNYVAGYVGGATSVKGILDLKRKEEERAQERNVNRAASNNDA